MSDASERLAQAQADADAARRRLTDTLAVVQARLNPRSLARESIDFAGEKAREGAELATQHPGKVAGAAVAVGLLLGRRRIARLFRRKHETSDHAARLSKRDDQSGEG